jgi:hypothetical protein
MVSVEKIAIAFFIIIVGAFIYNTLFDNNSGSFVPYSTEGFVPLLPASVSAPGTLLDYYPVIDPTGKLGDKDASQLWQNYPIYKVGSYDQITNNIRYPKNPDVGQCRPESMCNVLYGDRQEIAKPEPPPVEGKVRVGFYNTDTPAFY